MTEPLPSATIRTAPRTNARLRSLRLRLQATLNREITMDDTIWACVTVAEENEQATANVLA